MGRHSTQRVCLLPQVKCHEIWMTQTPWFYSVVHAVFCWVTTCLHKIPERLFSANRSSSLIKARWSLRALLIKGMTAVKHNKHLDFFSLHHSLYDIFWCSRKVQGLFSLHHSLYHTFWCSRKVQDLFSLHHSLNDTFWCSRKVQGHIWRSSKALFQTLNGV